MTTRALVLFVCAAGVFGACGSSANSAPNDASVGSTIDRTHAVEQLVDVGADVGVASRPGVIAVVGDMRPNLQPRVFFFDASDPLRSSPMNNPWEQWNPYWWQTVTAVPPFGMSFESSSTYAQPNDSWSESRSSPTAPAAPSGGGSGILGQLGQPANESSASPSPRPSSLLGQFLTGVGMAQAIPNGL